MKKEFLLILCALYLLSTLLTNFAYADSPSRLTLADSVYADLAVRGYLDNVSVSFYDGIAQNSFGINETRHWLPASTVKLFAAMYTFKLISVGKLHLNDTYMVDWKNVVSTELATPDLPTIQSGDRLTLDRLLRQMITQSDNTAFNVMLDIVKRKDITDYMHSLGLIHTAIGSKLNLDTSQTQYEFDDPGYGINSTTSDEYTTAFRLIWENKIPGSRPLLAILKQQKINYMLPLLLPKSVVVAHKHGDLDPLYHDGGVIIASKNKYVLSIFSNAGNPNLIAHLSELIYTRNYKLVGAALLTNASQQNAVGQTENFPLDPLVAQGGPLPTKYILGASTKTFTQALPPQGITAADLGINATDLSLVQSESLLPHVTIPSDSPWHILVTINQSLKHNFAFTKQQQEEADIQATLLQLADAKDLIARKKITEAEMSLKKIQSNVDAFVQEKTTKNNAQIQTAIQAISETRFQIYADVLKNASDTQRENLIKEIGEQAKNTIIHVQPDIPLAANATNPSQRPLIGQVIKKTDVSIIVQTAGGQEIAVPLDNPDITVKMKAAAPSFPLSSQSASEGAVPILSVTPTVKPSLSSVTVGSTIAILGSSVGNIFSPIFVLTNVPKELAAPEPVVVIKVNKNEHTMVIAENGVPVQVNVDEQTVIHGNDTNLQFDAIQAGDVVVVHGKPLVPVNKIPVPVGNGSVTATGSAPHTQLSPTFSPTNTAKGAQFLIAPQQASNSGRDKLFSLPTPSMSIVPSGLPPAHITRGNPILLPTHVTTSQQPLPTNTKHIDTIPSSTHPSPSPIQSRIIQGTSIQIIEKGVDTQHSQSSKDQSKPVKTMSVSQTPSQNVTPSKSSGKDH